MSGFLTALSFLTPLLAQLLPIVVPGLHPAAVPHIIAAASAAEQMPGKTGTQKLAAAVAIATQGLQVAQAQGADIDADALEQHVPEAVQKVADVVNSLKPHRKAIAAIAASK